MKKFSIVMMIALCVTMFPFACFASSSSQIVTKTISTRIIYTMNYETSYNFEEGDPIPPASRDVSIWIKNDADGKPIYASGTVYRYSIIYDGTKRVALYRGTLEYWEN